MSAKPSPSKVTHSATVASPADEAPGVELVRVYHRKSSGGSLIHGKYRLDPSGFADVPREVADIWMTHKGANDSDLVSETPGGAGEPPSAEKNRLKAENESLSAQIAKADERVKALEQLLAEAKESATGHKKH